MRVRPAAGAGGGRRRYLVRDERGEKEEELLALKEIIGEGKLRSSIDKVYPMELAAEAHRRVEAEERSGTVVISMKV